jgi:hypothetical protein
MSEMANSPLQRSAALPVAGYRQLWPWLLALVPVATILASAVTLWLAFSSEDGLVAEDYYKQGLSINRRIEREQAAAQLGLHADLQFDAAAGRVTVTLPRGTPRPTTLLLRVAHPTRSGLDSNVRLQSTGPDSYAGALELPVAPRWYVSIDSPDGAWRLSGDWRNGVNALHLNGGAR